MREKKYYQIIPFDNNIFRITSPEGVYMELFIGTHHALLLDTGFGFGNLKFTIQSITSLPLIVVNTHAHLDHCNGNYQFTDCPIYIHKNDWDMYDNNYKQENRKKTLNQARHKKLDWNSDEYVNILPDDLKDDNYIYANKGMTKPLTEGMIFNLGDITLTTIEVPGHTSGSCALLHNESGNLYIGDAANSNMVLGFGGSIELYKETLHKLQKLDFQHMILSHDSQLKEKSVLNDYIDCIENIDRQNFVTVASLFDFEHKDYMYIRKGYSFSDMNKPGFSSFIVSDKL